MGYADHAQQFGLPAPVNSIREAKQLLSNRIAKVKIHERTADLVIEFEGDVAFEVFNSSSGHEGWECSSDNGLLAIGVGGGELQTFLTDPPMR